jgi:hypothetical protein
VPRLNPRLTPVIVNHEYKISFGYSPAVRITHEKCCPAVVIPSFNDNLWPLF